jgi:translation initiation factor 2 alpha subunit (eIF-2alpha)
MSIKKSEIEDKSIKPSKSDNLTEFNYPEYNITVKAKNQAEADELLNQIINQENI